MKLYICMRSLNERAAGKMSPRKPLMPNYGPKAFLCMTTPLFVESIANCKEVSSFFAILCTYIHTFSPCRLQLCAANFTSWPHFLIEQFAVILLGEELFLMEMKNSSLLYISQWAKKRKKVHFGWTIIHCLPQRLKSIFFEKILSRGSPEGDLEGRHFYKKKRWF